MSKRDLLLAILNFSQLKSISNNAKIRSSLKFLLVRQYSYSKQNILKYLHWISNSMSFLVLFFCSYTATQRSNEMLLFTFWILSSCPLEEASCTLLFMSLYLHLISQGGLQSAEQLYGPTVSSSLTVNFPLLSSGFGSIDNILGSSTNKYAMLQVCFLKMHNVSTFILLVLKIGCFITNHCAS